MADRKVTELVTLTSLADADLFLVTDDVGGTPISKALRADALTHIGRTATEISAGVTPSDYSYPEGNVLRYGADPTGVADSYTAIQDALNVGGRVYVPGGSYKVGTQLIIKADTTLILDAEAIIRRAWAGTNGTRPDNATIKNENALLSASILVDPGPATVSTWDENIHIIGGQWGHFADDVTTYRGTHIGLIGVRYGAFRDATFKSQDNEWCSVFWVEEFDIENIQINVETGSGVSNDGIHVIGGQNINIDRIRGGNDDDFIAIGSNANIGISNVTVSNIACDTESNAVKILQIRSGSTAAFGTPTEKVRKISISNISGIVGADHTGLIDILTQGHTDYTLLEDITITNVVAEMGTAVDTVNTIGVDINGGRNISISNLSLRAPVRDAIRAANANDVRVHNVWQDDLNKSGERGLEFTTCNRVQIIGGQYRSSTQQVMYFEDVADIQVIGVDIRDISDGFAGVFMDGTSNGIVSGCKFTRAAGATTSKGVRTNTGATISQLIVSGNDFVDVDTTIQLSAIPTVFAQDYNAGHVFGTFGNADTTPSVAEYSKFLSGTATSTISDFDNGYTGQEITVISKAAITYDTTGTDLTGSSVDIITASGDITRWVCEDGTTWRLLAFVDVSVDNSAGA